MTTGKDHHEIYQTVIKGAGVAMLIIALTSQAEFMSLEVEGVHNIINRINTPEMLTGRWQMKPVANRFDSAIRSMMKIRSSPF